MPDTPHVSIVIPCRNRAALVRKSIDSALAQTYTDHEIVLVDDGSTDGTREVLAGDPRYRHVRYLRHETPRGAQAARNTGIRASRGRYVAFLDSDDEWLPRKLELQIDAARGEEVVVHGDAIIISESSGASRLAGVPPIEGNARKALLAAPGPLFPCLLAPRSSLQAAGYLDEAVPAYQEWDTSLVLSRNCGFRFVPEPLMTYRLHCGDQISKSNESAARGFLYIVRKHRDEIRSVLGPPAMTRHYLAISERFLGAGKHRLSARYALAAFVNSPRSIHLLARATLLLCGKPGARVLSRRQNRRLSKAQQL